MANVKITVTVPEETREWLRETYSDHTSDSARVANAIRDARSLQQVMDTRNIVDFQMPEDPGDVAIQSEEVRVDSADLEDSED